jgi:hypothetical protein
MMYQGLVAQLARRTEYLYYTCTEYVLGQWGTVCSPLVAPMPRLPDASDATGCKSRVFDSQR